MVSKQNKIIVGSTATALAASIEDAIQGRRLGVDQLLPTIRALAASLKVSPATVAAAYRVVQARGLIAGQGRRGTRVRASISAVHAPVASHVPDGAVDLASGNPDPALFPPLGPALRAMSTRPHMYGDPLQLRALLAFVGGEFDADGIASDALVIVGGALDGIERILREHLRKGDHLALEDPTLPALIDLVRAMGYTPEPVALDDEGPMPEALQVALRRRARALVLTPRAQNPTGAALTSRRAADLRRVLHRFPDVLVVENDAASPIAHVPAVSVCGDSTVHWAVVRTTSKFLGPDLRLAVVAGDPLTIGRVQRRQAVGARWVSHLLQRLTLELWSDPASGRLLARAAEIYAQRRSTLVGALATQGIDASSRSGFNVWIPVRDEGATVRALAERGWAVAAGERFRLSSQPGIRVTAAALVPHDAQRFAADLAAIHRPAAAVFA